MKTEKLAQLEKEEKELYKRLDEIRREKAKIKQQLAPKLPTKKVVIDNDANYKKADLEHMSKAEVINIAGKMGIPLDNRKTKIFIVDAIIRHQRAKARGAAFAKMI